MKHKELENIDGETAQELLRNWQALYLVVMYPAINWQRAMMMVFGERLTDDRRRSKLWYKKVLEQLHS